MKLSALVLTKNEQEMIEECLKRLNFVDEIIILDQGSQDKTTKIAEKYTKNIFSTNNQSFAKNREVLASHARGEWLLYVDADERLEGPTISQIIEAIATDKYQAYYFPRKNIVLGKWLKHGGWWPDYVPKLFKKSALSAWYGDVHESPKVEGSFGYIQYPITHQTARSLSLMLQKSIKWAKVEASLAYGANHPKVTAPKLVWASTKEILVRYIAKLGFLDGFVGLVESIYQGLHKAMILVYLWELQNKTEDKFKKMKKKYE